MTSLKDVAALAGVSPSTVSRVINNTMHVTDETRMRVEEAIRAVNYRPNLLAQSLRLRATKNIGLLVPEIAHPSFNLVIKYIEESASRRGLNLIIVNTNNDPKKEAKAIDLLIRQKINGIIFSRVSDESHVLNISQTTKTPMVVIDRAFADESLSTVILNNYKAGQLAAEHLLSVGCKRVATITGSFKVGLSRQRHKGFIDTIEKHGGSVDSRLIYEGSFTFETGIDGIACLLESGLEFDGVWGHNDMIAAGAISTLLHKGYKVPTDIAVMGMDDVQFASMFYPTITTIAQPYSQMCEMAVDVIDRLTSGEEMAKQYETVEPLLIVRESTMLKEL